MSKPLDKAAAPRLAQRVDEAAATIGVGRDKNYGPIKSGDLGARKFGSVTLIAHQDLARFVEDLPELDLRDGG